MQMYSYLTDANDVFRDINIAELDKDTDQSRRLLKRASVDYYTDFSVIGFLSHDKICGQGVWWEQYQRPRNSSRKVFRIGTVRYHWPMSAHASQAFSIASCTDSEDLPSSMWTRSYDDVCVTDTTTTSGFWKVQTRQTCSQCFVTQRQRLVSERFTHDDPVLNVL